MPAPTPTAKRTQVFYRMMPKVELHRHLEGSLRLKTLVEVARSHGIDVLGTDRLRSLVQINDSEAYTFQNFLSKFQTLRLFYRTPEIVGRVTREAIADAALDNVRYLELRFTPVALSRAQGFSLGEVMDWVIEGARDASQEYAITTRMIVSFNRNEPVELAEQVVQLAVDRRSQGIVGIDLAGNEAEFSARPFSGVINAARQAGLQTTIHAGEWSGAANVAEAIEQLGADRIGHGVRVIEDAGVVHLARERGIPFEVCLTSNYQSGVVASLQEHPFRRMLGQGLNVTLNTDDPSISNITLGDEYYLTCEELGTPLTVLHDRILAAARAAFLPEAERMNLVKSLRAELEKTVPIRSE